LNGEGKLDAPYNGGKCHMDAKPDTARTLFGSITIPSKISRGREQIGAGDRLSKCIWKESKPIG